MKLERTKNSVKGIVSGMINKIILLIIPFIVRTIFIKTLGMEYLGLNSLFSSILNILNLAELGVGSAIVFSLYSAIAKNDEKEICALMNFYKKIYRIIGILVVAIGLIILPFIRQLCKGSVPTDVNIYILYLMYLVNSASSYFLYAYKNCLLTAYQQTYISNNVSTFVKVGLNVLQAIFLLLGQGYYVYLALAILATITENIVNAIWATRKYPNYKANGEIPKDEKKMIYKKVKALFFYKVGGVVLSSVDSIVISSFLGLTVLGKYNNYYYVITVLFGFLQIYMNSMLAGIGNSIASETKEKNIKDFNILNFVQGWIVGWCSICLVCLYQPFMELWAGSENMFSNGIAIALAIYFYVWKMMDVTNLYKEAAGLWEYDKFRPLVASAVNLISNILLVKLIGIYGIMVSTILSIIIVILPWSTYVLYKQYFKTGLKEFWKKYIVNILVTVLAALATYGICSLIKKVTFVTLILKGIICIIVPNIIYLILYSRTQDFKNTKLWVKDKLKIFSITKKVKMIIQKISINKYKYIKSMFIILCILIMAFVIFAIYIGKEEVKYLSKITTVNFSIDDCIDVFEDLTINENYYESIFDNNNLKYLKDLHDKYDAKFTLYVFYEFDGKSLKESTTKFKNEFEENSDWLKFGFHAYNNNRDYSKIPTDEAYQDYVTTMERLKNIVGENSINYIVRIEKFKMSKENLNSINTNEDKILGLLGADTKDRENYYLTKEENNQLFIKDYIYDNELGIAIYNTDLRIEEIGFSILDENCIQDDILVIFTHEWQLNTINKLKINRLIKRLSNNNVIYSFL